MGSAPSASLQDARAIFDVLVEECLAQPSLFSQFLSFLGRDDDPREFRFIGALGFGGKYWTHTNTVSCYPENETPGRLLMIDRANARLARLLTGADSSEVSS